MDVIMKIKCEVQQNTNTGNCNMDISFYCTTFRFFFLFSIFTKKCTITALNLFFLSPPINLCSYKNMVVNECLCNTITLLQYFFSELSFVIFPVFLIISGRKQTLLLLTSTFQSQHHQKSQQDFFHQAETEIHVVEYTGTTN